jgi:hypothetical protein
MVEYRVFGIGEENSGVHFDPLLIGGPRWPVDYVLSEVFAVPAIKL